MPDQKPPANEEKSTWVSLKVSVKHPFSDGEEEVTIIGTTQSGLLECKRPEAFREAILWFKPVDGKLVYVPF